MRFLGVHLFALFLLFLSSGCLKDGEVLVDDLASIKAQVFKVENQNGKLVIEGKNLNATQKVQIKGNSIDNEMVIQSKSKTRIVAALSQALTFTASAMYELVLSNAYGQSVYQLSFEIQDGQVTTVKLADGAVTGDKIADMGALSGQILKYNGTTWTPADLNSLVYAGTWDASTGTEPNSSPVGGDFWIVDTDGDVDLGDGNGVRQWRIGDWIVYNSFTGQWDQVISSQSVVSFNGRAGEVEPEQDDYTWQQIDKTLAPIGDLTDVDTTTMPPSNGEVLKWDGSNWVPQVDENDGGDITSVNAGTGLLGGATSGDADLDIDVGTSANQIPQLDGSGLLLNSIIPNLDTSKITNGTMNTARLPYASSTTDGIISSSDYQTFSGADTTLSNGAAGEYLDGDGNWYILDKAAVGLGNVTNDEQIPASSLDTNTNLGTDDTLVPSQNAVKSYVDDSVSTASEDYLLRDGSQAMTGDFDGGANELTNISNATLSSELRLGDLDDLEYVGFKAPDNVTTNYVWKLPGAEGGAGQVLSTDGSGNLSWASSGDGSVTDVTATLPLSSSGTNTPDISISQSSSTTDGYLSSTDWNTFDAKEDALGTGTANQYLDENKTWQNLDTDAVIEGSNLYYTTARARTDAVGDTIVDAVTDVAPSQNAVFDALALKADQSSLSNYVLKGGDTMTGALNLPADGLAVGTNQLITSGGNVGVGTTSPTSKIHLVDNQNAMVQMQIRNEDETSGSAASRVVALGASSGISMEKMNSGYVGSGARRARAGTIIDSGSTGLNFASANAGSDMRFYTGGITDTEERVRIDGAGNVGIGTSSPAVKLQVEGEIRSQVAGQGAKFSNAEANDYLLLQTSDDSLRFFSNDNERLSVSSSGDLSTAGLGAKTIFYKNLSAYWLNSNATFGTGFTKTYANNRIDIDLTTAYSRILTVPLIPAGRLDPLKSYSVKIVAKSSCITAECDLRYGIADDIDFVGGFRLDDSNAAWAQLNQGARGTTLGSSANFGTDGPSMTTVPFMTELTLNISPAETYAELYIQGGSSAPPMGVATRVLDVENGLSFEIYGDQNIEDYSLYGFEVYIYEDSM